MERIKEKDPIFHKHAMRAIKGRGLRELQEYLREHVGE
jgi:hypothetical protein